nr:MAG TPA: hypothetical protein [Bacteriophage sp.]
MDYCLMHYLVAWILLRECQLIIWVQKKVHLEKNLKNLIMISVILKLIVHYNGRLD